MPLRGLCYLTLGLVLFFSTVGARADEGMWEFSNLPLQALKSKYNFVPTDPWLQHVMKSSVRFNNGGSGSFVSGTGLILTNHHVASDTLAKISGPGHDFYNNGFYAKMPDQEVPAPDLEIDQLQSIEDVTARVASAVTPSMTPAQAYAARQAVIAQIEAESTQQTGLRSDVVTLYEGGAYHLYRYHRYTDVRLVFSPELAAAFFGGDPDNFEYPRYDLDIALFRAYENGKPVQTDHFKWAAHDVQANDLVFVSGNPGTTNRNYTVAALEYLRDVAVPFNLDYLERQEIFLQQYAERGQDETQQSSEDLFATQNSRKVYTGMLAGLQDQRLIDRKQQAEYDLRAQALQNPKLQGMEGAWDQIAQAQTVRRQTLTRYGLLEIGLGFQSRLFTIARDLVRMADEDAKPDDERLPEFRQAARASLEQTLFSPAPFYPEYEKAKLAHSLSFLVEKLGEEDALVQSVLQGESPDDRATDLVDGTSLAKVDVRHLLVQGGKAAIAQSLDPMIRLAALVEPASRSVRKTYDTEVTGVEQQAYAEIAQIQFALQGTTVYPDATFTPRLAFGQVKGYAAGGVTYDPFTTFAGAFQHEADHGAVAPYALPPSWHAQKSVLDLSAPLNFVSTADITGGNSGSPVVDRDGDFAGIIFDENIQSLTTGFQYDDTASRAIAVSSGAILASLAKIYGASALVTELTQ